MSSISWVLSSSWSACSNEIEEEWSKLLESRNNLCTKFESFSKEKDFPKMKLAQSKNQAKDFLDALKEFGHHKLSECRAIRADAQFYEFGPNSAVVRQCAEVEESLSEAQKSTEWFLEVIHPSSSQNILEQMNPSKGLIQGHWRIFGGGDDEFRDKMSTLEESIKQLDKASQELEQAKQDHC